MNGALRPSAIELGVDANALARLERGVSAGARLGLDADDAAVDGGGDARDEPAAADGDDDRRDVGEVLEDLEPERALAGLEHRVVERDGRTSVPVSST